MRELTAERRPLSVKWVLAAMIADCGGILWYMWFHQATINFVPTAIKLFGGVFVPARSSYLPRPLRP